MAEQQTPEEQLQEHLNSIHNSIMYAIVHDYEKKFRDVQLAAEMAFHNFKGNDTYEGWLETLSYILDFNAADNNLNQLRDDIEPHQAQANSILQQHQDDIDNIEQYQRDLHEMMRSLHQIQERRDHVYRYLINGDYAYPIQLDNEFDNQVPLRFKIFDPQIAQQLLEEHLEQIQDLFNTLPNQQHFDEVRQRAINARDNYDPNDDPEETFLYLDHFKGLSERVERIKVTVRDSWQLISRIEREQRDAVNLEQAQTARMMVIGYHNIIYWREELRKFLVAEGLALNKDQLKQGFDPDQPLEAQLPPAFVQQQQQGDGNE